MKTYRVPIKNVLYMYSYIWDRKRTDDFIDLKATDDFVFSDLLAELFLKQVKQVIKRGLSKEYVDRKEEITAVRGRIDYRNTVLKQSLNKGRVYCEFDEYEENILLNQIVKNSAIRLYRTDDISFDNKKNLRSVIDILDNVDFVELDRNDFSKIRLNRNNDYYFMLLKICELIITSSMLDSKSGEYHFYNIFDDDEHMCAVFELFVYKFYDQELPEDHKVYFQKQLRFNVENDEDLMLPVMKMDTVIESADRTLIIDTKYYKEYMQAGQSRDKLISVNIYQMMSYLNSINTDKENLKGMLLYPKPYDMDEINRTYSIDVTSNGEIKKANLQFTTVDLSKDWRDIKKNLLDLVI